MSMGNLLVSVFLSFPPAQGLQMFASMPKFYISAGDRLNTPHAYVASTSPSNPSSQSLK